MSSSKTEQNSDESSIESTVKSQEEEDEDRGAWGNKLEYILSILAVAVGLGNIWRFPTRAYENGGSAFLFPYITCSLVFGLPTLYAELVFGQHHRKTPAKIFKSISPVLAGVGWMAVIVSGIIAIYYMTLIGWIVMYLIGVFSGHTALWTHCDNEWNDKAHCYDSRSYTFCNQDNSNYTAAQNVTKFFYLDGQCLDANLYSGVRLMSATEQYFEKYVMRKSTGLLDINFINWKTCGSLAFLWILIIATLFKGVKYLGKANYISIPLPYIIVIAFLIRGVTLPGASTGLYYYLGKPDWSKIWLGRTWAEALMHLCFSISLGQGTMVSMSTYNKRSNNCFKDAIIVIVGDTIMSILGGAAVFSVLGFLAETRGVEVTEVIHSGLSLAFTVYPEAMAQMPVPWLWSFLFFFMLFLLGFSSEASFMEVVHTSIYDHFPSTRSKKLIIVICSSICVFLLSIPQMTDAGVFWFEMFDEYTAGFASIFSVVLELLIISWLYGYKNVRHDIAAMMGRSKNGCLRLFSKNSPYFLLNWSFISPVIGILLLGLCLNRSYPFNNNPVSYPPAFDIIGWTLAFLPAFPIPILAVVGYFKWKASGYPIRGFFMMQTNCSGYSAIYQKMSDEKKTKQQILPNPPIPSKRSRRRSQQKSNRGSEIESVSQSRRSKTVEDSSVHSEASKSESFTFN